MKFRVEGWRIAKFLLITLAVNLPLTLLNGALVNTLTANHSATTGMWLSALSYGHMFLSATVLCLLHRYFTFRATEKWYIAVPIMLLYVFGWHLLRALPMAAAARVGMDAHLSMSNLLSAASLVLQYLLQRCVIYCHTTDTNGWYRRFHPTNEEGA